MHIVVLLIVLIGLYYCPALQRNWLWVVLGYLAWYYYAYYYQVGQASITGGWKFLKPKTWKFPWSSGPPKDEKGQIDFSNL